MEWTKEKSIKLVFYFLIFLSFAMSGACFHFAGGLDFLKYIGFGVSLIGVLVIYSLKKYKMKIGELVRTPDVMSDLEEKISKTYFGMVIIVISLAWVYFSILGKDKILYLLYFITLAVVEIGRMVNLRKRVLILKKEQM